MKQIIIGIFLVIVFSSVVILTVMFEDDTIVEKWEME